jgi:thiamine-monophosphate kinase
MAGFDEFSLIKKLFLPLAVAVPESLGLTDDVALVDGKWAITVDAIVAGVHFLPDDPPDLIARKLVRVNLSDLAAKGAEPRFLLLAACFPRTTSSVWFERFADGLHADCAEFKVALIGGDTVATPGPLTLSLTALGIAGEKPALLRSNARSGDNIWVSGTLGDAALGLQVAKKGAVGLPSEHAEFLLDRYRLPQPRLGLGRRLRGLAHACMDVSDGLIGDLAHICEASGKSAVVEAASLPLSPAAMAAKADMAAVAAGGDDYELLFTAPPSADHALAALSAELDLKLTRIGRIGDGEGVRLLGAGGSEITGLAGYRHFS